MSYLQEKSFQFWGAFILALIAFIWLFNPILSPFVVGFVVAYLLNPIVQKLARRGIPRWLSAFVILAIFFITMIVGLMLAVPVLIREMIEFIKLLPVAFDNGRIWISQQFPMIDIPQSLEDIKNIDSAAVSEKMGSVLQFGGNIMENIFKSGVAVLGVISFLALMPIIAFYLLIDWARVTDKIKSFLPRKNSKRIESMLTDIDLALAGFIRGQLTVCFLLGAFYAIALSILGLEYGFFVGVASGILSIIPYVGSIFGLGASVGLAFYQFGGWEYPLAAFIIFIVGQLVEGNYLTPKLVGDSVGLHPLWVIFALMAGGTLLGLLGMIIAVPVAAIITVIIKYAADDYRQSAYYKGKK